LLRNAVPYSLFSFLRSFYPTRCNRSYNCTSEFVLAGTLTIGAEANLAPPLFPIVKSKANFLHLHLHEANHRRDFLLTTIPFASISIPSVTSLQQALPTRSSLSPTTSAAPEPVKQIETIHNLHPRYHCQLPIPSDRSTASQIFGQWPSTWGTYETRVYLPSFAPISSHTCANECSDPKEGNSDIACLSNVHNANCLLVQTRKGTVGARLPYEPWNMDLSELNPRTPRSPSTTPSATTHSPKLAAFRTSH